MQLNNTKVSFIGAGNMASAIVGGLLEKGLPAQNIFASDPSEEKLAEMQSRLGIQVSQSNEAAIQHADVLVLCVKPQVLERVCCALSSAIEAQGCLVVSIAAGIEVKSLEGWLGANTALVRCMPNTPAQVMSGASGLYANTNVTEQQRDIALELFKAVGVAQWVESEDLIHAVTALSGSGPAYIFLMISAMAEAGVKLGLEPETAKQLAAQTVQGAAKMVLASDVSPDQLKRNVMSPGGTTERAISVFEGDGLVALVEKAMTAAADRSVEMAAELGDKAKA
jgi:pyrroline-5-carboxylate reductase